VLHARLKRSLFKAAFWYIRGMVQKRWYISVADAKAQQIELSRAVRLAPLSSPIRTIAGADISCERFGYTFHAAIVVLSFPELEIVETAFATMDVAFPYVPGYLSFREIPPLIAAYEKLRARPDVIMMDGQGIAHPRRIGVATHLGVVLNTPTIGCAKSLLYGEGKAPGLKKGSAADLIDPKDGSVIGARLRTKDAVAPVIVSPGHRITLEESLSIARSCARRHRIPEPTRRAHILVNAYRKEAA
jgi:deoxyribonuclease V